ncbi:MAG: lipid A deacylase LpxR family protein [Deltaproteobacteria bacterium]|nr:lipid A deacylase LpxR family protein [Deltaproteobacteria bacterium]
MEQSSCPARILKPGLCAFLFIILLMPLSAAAESALPDISGSQRSFSFYMENDVFAGQDSQYTNGLKLTWSRFGMDKYPDIYPYKLLYPVVNFVGFGKTPGSVKAITFSIGQNIYTPDDIEDPDIVKDDRPYAGITYFEIGFHQRNGRHMDTLEFYGGLVGPDSYAEEVQSSVHSLINTKDPKGWDNQLNDEPVIGIIYEYKKRMLDSNLGNGFGHDLIFNTGGGIGNAQTYYSMGLLFRLGINIPDDFGNYPIRPASVFNAILNEKTSPSEHNLGIHLFFSVNGNAVIRNIFLDGNSFSSSHSVTKKPLVSELVGGIAFNAERLKASMAYVYQSKTFETQKNANQFGSINISFLY